MIKTAVFQDMALCRVANIQQFRSKRFLEVARVCAPKANISSTFLKHYA